MCRIIGTCVTIAYLGWLGTSFHDAYLANGRYNQLPNEAKVRLEHIKTLDNIIRKEDILLNELKSEKSNGTLENSKKRDKYASIIEQEKNEYVSKKSSVFQEPGIDEYLKIEKKKDNADSKFFISFGCSLFLPLVWKRYA